MTRTGSIAEQLSAPYGPFPPVLLPVSQRLLSHEAPLHTCAIQQRWLNVWDIGA